MPLGKGDRVTLTDSGATGEIKGLVGDTGAYVKLDSGPACTFPLSRLAPEGKAWPPALETK